MMKEVEQERERWIKLCKTPVEYGGLLIYQPEIEIIQERMREMAAEMEDEPLVDSVSEERARWCALFRDYLTTFPFSHGKMDIAHQVAVKILYEIAADMENIDVTG